MGSLASSLYQTAETSEVTKVAILDLLQDMREKDVSKMEWSQIKQYINNIPKGENILSIQSEDGYNVLQQAIGLNCVELIKWILTYGCDVNGGACSLPLHIAVLHGQKEIVELLLNHGASVDIKARMCFSGAHNENCNVSGMGIPDQNSDQLQSAEYYAIEGDQPEILDMLLAQKSYSWFSWHQKSPLLHLACEKGAWNCTKFLVTERSDEINLCYNEYCPIHLAVKQDIKFLEILLQCGVDVSVRTATQKMTVLHVLLLHSQKSTKVTLQTLKMLLDHRCRNLVNEPDILGNTPLHALIVRYALEESRFGYAQEPGAWNKWDMLHILIYLLQNGASPSINLQGNSALSCVLKHIKDLEFRNELLETLLTNGGNPNIAGPDGSVPLMSYFMSLLYRQPAEFLSQYKKVFHLKSVLLLCKHGANPNCSSKNNMTPLHVLAFMVCLNTEREKYKKKIFVFLRKLLDILLQYKLDPYIQFSEENGNIPHEERISNHMIRCGLDPNTLLSKPYECLLQTLRDVAA